jgi:hypothetical protein
MAGKGKKQNQRKPKPKPKQNRPTRQRQPNSAKMRNRRVLTAMPGTVSKIRNATSGNGSIASRIAYAIANNCSTSTLRLNTYCDIEPTATVSIHNVFSFDGTKAWGNLDTWTGEGVMPVILFRDPLRSIIRLVTNSARDAFNYTATLMDPDLTEVGEHEIHPLSFAPSYSNTRFRPHGNTLYCGRHSRCPTKRWVLMNPTDKIDFHVTSSSGPDKIMCYVLESNTGNFEEVAKLDIVSGLATYSNNTLNRPSYLSFTFHAESSVSNRNLDSMYLYSDITDPATGDYFGQIAIPGVDTHANVLKNFRVNAASILLSPNTSLLNQSGTIHAISSQHSVRFFDHLKISEVNNVTSKFDYSWSRRNYRDGMYAFSKPSGQEDFKWCCNDSQSEGGYAYDASKDMFFSLDPAPVLIFMMQVDPSGTYSVVVNGDTTHPISKALYPGARLEITAMHSLEFKPVDDQWYDTRLPANTHNDFALALQSLAHIPTFYDNPFHLADIAQKLRTSYNFVHRNRNGIGAAISAVLPPHFRPAVNAATQFLGTLPIL